MEVKGTGEYGQRFTFGVSSEFAGTFAQKFQRRLPGDWSTIGWRRPCSANRVSFNLKLVLVLEERRAEMNDNGLRGGAADDQGVGCAGAPVAINSKTCFVVLPAAPWRREF